MAANIVMGEQDYDRAQEIKQFDNSKLGVKGRVDSGVTSIPRFFIHPPEVLQGLRPNTKPETQLRIPTIDLACLDTPASPLSDLVEYRAEPPKISPKSCAFEGPKIESRSSARDPLKELVVRVDRDGPLDPRSKFGAFEELAEEADIRADLPEGLKPKSEAKRPSKSFLELGLYGSASSLFP